VTTVAVFGGSFNPPHIAHVMAVTYVLSTEDVERVLVVPTYQHPFAKSLAPYEERLHMCELAMGWIPRVEISRVEQELGGESKTVRTLEHLLKKNEGWKLRLVIGADILVESSKWFAFDRIKEIAPLLVLGRAGVEHDEAPRPILPMVSSTEIRARLAARDLKGLQTVVPRSVLSHIASKGLYTAAA
jgi:nicotinate-nucleotide adenylyltransferase